MDRVISHDPRFDRLIIGHAKLEKLWTGSRWAEGPAYFPAGRYLVWSDIPNDRLMRFDETDGSVSVFRQPSGNANGNTTDRQGRLITCEHLQRRVTRTEHDGSVTVLADRLDGKRLNSPNDVVVASDGAIWFTDPTYGIDTDYEGETAQSEIGASTVYRLLPDGILTAVICDRVQPNGLAFSPNETLLYVIDTGASHQPGLPVTIHAYDVVHGTISPERQPRHFATCLDGFFDGLRCDVYGNVWTSAGRSVHCYAPDGAHLGTIAIGEMVANLCFGGAKRNRLYICAQTSLYSIFLAVTGSR